MLAPFPARWSTVAESAPGTPGGPNPNNARPGGSVLDSTPRHPNSSCYQYKHASNRQRRLSPGRDPSGARSCVPKRSPEDIVVSRYRSEAADKHRSSGREADPGRGRWCKQHKMASCGCWPSSRAVRQSGAVFAGLTYDLAGWRGLTKYTTTLPPETCTSPGYTYNG